MQKISYDRKKFHFFSSYYQAHKDIANHRGLGDKNNARILASAYSGLESRNGLIFSSIKSLETFPTI